jgi:hypothetical protein
METVMRQDIEDALAPLAGCELRATERVLDTLVVRFGVRADNGSAGPGEITLHVSCAWRLVDGGHVLVGAGDLFTPADPDGEPESFDWEPQGASWLDVRLAEVAARREAGAPHVTAAAVDPYGGLRLTLSDGLALELFPSSTPTGHVSTEFWRLIVSGADDLVVGTFGVEREAAE